MVEIFFLFFKINSFISPAMELTVLGQTLQQGYDFKFLGQITLINGVLSNTKSIFKVVFFLRSESS